MKDRNDITLGLPEGELDRIIKAAAIKQVSVEEFINLALVAWIENNHPDDWQEMQENKQLKGVNEEDLVVGAVYLEKGIDEDGEEYNDLFEYLGKVKNYKPGKIHDYPFAFFNVQEQEPGMYSKRFLTEITAA